MNIYFMVSSLAWLRPTIALPFDKFAEGGCSAFYLGGGSPVITAEIGWKDTAGAELTGVEGGAKGTLKRQILTGCTSTAYVCCRWIRVVGARFAGITLAGVIEGDCFFAALLLIFRRYRR